MSPGKLVHMANQIGKFFTHQGDEKAIASIADHIMKFWVPQMREAILAHRASGGRPRPSCPPRRAKVEESSRPASANLG